VKVFVFRRRSSSSSFVFAGSRTGIGDEDENEGEAEGNFPRRAGLSTVNPSGPLKVVPDPEKDQRMKRIVSLLAFASVVVSVSAANFAAAVVDYQPGAGFTARFTNTAAVLGEPSRVNPFEDATDPFNPAYGTGQILSLGEGGVLTIQFAAPVLNHPRNRFGVDFMIFGNSGFIITNEFDFDTFTWIGTPATDGSLFGYNPGITRVSVSRDGVAFYELDPRYAPAVDVLLPTDGAADFSTPADPELVQADFVGLTLEQIRALYHGSAGGAGYDLEWARDAAGRRVALNAIQFVRIEVLSGKAEVDGLSGVFHAPGRSR
jgi:hypothetical protein